MLSSIKSKNHLSGQIIEKKLKVLCLEALFFLEFNSRQNLFDFCQQFRRNQKKMKVFSKVEMQDKKAATFAFLFLQKME